MYKAVKIDTRTVKTPDDYNSAVNGAGQLFPTLQKAKDFCGGYLRKMAGGYAASIGPFDYVVIRI